MQAASVQDLSGGNGAIHRDLLADVAETATHVDASSAYLSEACAQVARRDHTDRVTFVHADFMDVADELPDADIVTLDRVLCCYPDFHTLLTTAASEPAGPGHDEPREMWYTRVALRLENAFQTLRGDPFRGFLHPVLEKWTGH